MRDTTAAADAVTADPRDNLVGLSALIAANAAAVPVHDFYSSTGAPLYDEFATSYDSVVPVELALETPTGAVLDLGCGSGRLTLLLADRGLDVVGLDLSQDMLDRAEEHRARRPENVRSRATFLQGDMTAIDLDQRFQSVVLGATSIVLADPAHRPEMFQRIYDHLLPGGRFFLDVQDLDIRDLRRNPDRTFVSPMRSGPDGAVRYAVFCQRFDVSRRSERVNFVLHRLSSFGEVEIEILTSMKRIVFSREIERDLRAAGFELAERRPSHGPADHGYEWIIAGKGTAS